MRTLYKPTLAAAMIMLAIACGGDGGNKKLEAQKAKLEKLKEQRETLNSQILELETDIAKIDTSAGNTEKAKLVTLAPIEGASFVHFIDLQGKIEAEDIVWVTPRGAGGQVTQIYVKQGQYVKKGQLLMKLDDAVTNQQIEQVKVQLSLAESLYQRRKNLWEENIGTEVELLQAKTNVDNLKKQIDLLKEQLDMSNIYAQISGVADQVSIKVGETFTPQTATMSGIRLVNTSDLKAVAQVPENYLDNVSTGSVVKVFLPDVDQTFTTKVSVAGRIIDPNSRSFYIEARMPDNKNIRPNQIAVVKIQDYNAKDAITIPMNTLQNDEKGKFVLVATKENGKLVAHKKPVEVGQMYAGQLEVKSGLQAGEQLITEGFQGLYDGQLITTEMN